MPTIKVRDHAIDGEDDRATITANGIVIDVIAHDDGSVYVEMYAYMSGHQVVDEHGPATPNTYTIEHRGG